MSKKWWTCSCSALRAAPAEELERLEKLVYEMQAALRALAFEQITGEEAMRRHAKRALERSKNGFKAL